MNLEGGFGILWFSFETLPGKSKTGSGYLKREQIEGISPLRLELPTLQALYALLEA
jgi:hypothetical protein